MENLIRVDFGTNRVEKTRKQWIDELIKYQLECLDSVNFVDGTVTYFLHHGFVGYDNMSNGRLSVEIYDTLVNRYDIEEYSL